MITKEEADFAAKQEISNGDDAKIYTARKTTATSTWSRLKDPRIVRVSRAMGGKDRHSKVCTVRGLRDRRVRLSVPTAIQLYDLQERIGLSQPSKVVDWLLDAAKKEIDELPPLQIPQGITFNPNKEALEEKHVFSSERNDRSWTGRSEEESHEFHLQNPSSFASLISSSSYGRWDPSISLGLASHQHQDFPSHQHQQHQLLVYQSGMITQPYFVPQINAPFDTKHPSFHSSDLSSSSHGVRAFDFSMTADLLPSLNDEENKRGHPQT